MRLTRVTDDSLQSWQTVSKSILNFHQRIDVVIALKQ